MLAYKMTSYVYHISIIFPATQSSMGMEDAHRRVLRLFLPEFIRALQIDQIVRNLLDNGTITKTSADNIKAKTTRPAKVEELVLNVLPKCGPDAFTTFYNCLQSNQLQLASDFKNKARGNIVKWEYSIMYSVLALVSVPFQHT